VTDRRTDRRTGQTDRKWVPIWRAGDEWPVLIPKLLAIARSLDKYPNVYRSTCQPSFFRLLCAAQVDLFEVFDVRKNENKGKERKRGT
jgi:hypothetical protein